MAGPDAFAASAAASAGAYAIDVDHVSRIYQKYSSRHRFQTFKSALVKGDLFKALRNRTSS